MLEPPTCPCLLENLDEEELNPILRYLVFEIKVLNEYRKITKLEFLYPIILIRVQAVDISKRSLKYFYFNID